MPCLNKPECIHLGLKKDAVSAQKLHPSPELFLVHLIHLPSLGPSTERHVHAEHDPHGAGQGGGTDHGAPDQAQLADAVDRKPIGEGLDPEKPTEEWLGRFYPLVVSK